MRAQGRTSGGMVHGISADAPDVDCPGIGKPCTLSYDAFAGDERGRTMMVVAISNIVRFGLDCINLIDTDIIMIILITATSQFM
jgi:hypothetical protein